MLFCYFNLDLVVFIVLLFVLFLFYKVSVLHYCVTKGIVGPFPMMPLSSEDEYFK